MERAVSSAEGVDTEEVTTGVSYEMDEMHFSGTSLLFTRTNDLNSSGIPPVLS